MSVTNPDLAAVDIMHDLKDGVDVHVFTVKWRLGHFGLNGQSSSKKPLISVKNWRPDLRSQKSMSFGHKELTCLIFATLKNEILSMVQLEKK